MTTSDNGVAIEIEGLRKSFKNRFRRTEVAAVRDVSLTVQRGDVVAFVGPNGAGKTTTIFAMLGLLKPDRGHIRIFGQPAGSIEARRRTGFQSEIFYTYGFKTIERVLDFYGVLSDMPNEARADAVPRQIARLGLSAASGRKVRGFSKGMTQRLGLAQALLHQPDLLLLDEPTTGLDPEGRKLVSDIILQEKARGATIFLSSHILSDVERTCDHVVILSKGTVVFAESMTKIRSEAHDWEIEVTAWTPAAREAVPQAAVGNTEAPSFVRCMAADKDALLVRLLSAGANIGVVRRTHSLEDLYMRYAGGSSSG